MTKDDAYETAMELFDFAEMIRDSGETDRLEEAKEAYQQAVAIKDQYFP
jgi:hypothetical protein